MNIFLNEFSKEYSQYRNIMIMDKAGWHRSYSLEIPDKLNSINNVESTLENALYELYDEKEEMKSLCNFKWLYNVS